MHNQHETANGLGAVGGAAPERSMMARYIVITTLDLRGIPSYYVVDTADNSRVRRYDCEPWAQHEADRMNGIPEQRKEADKSLFRRLWDALSLHKTKGV